MAQATPFKVQTVLIVDDQALIRMELAAQLGEMGLKVLAASNANQAMELLDLHSDIDAVVTDIRMPGSMDGVRLARYVRHRWPPVKIVVVSGLGQTKLSELPDGSAFVCKPYDLETVLDALVSVVNRQNVGPTDTVLN